MKADRIVHTRLTLFGKIGMLLIALVFVLQLYQTQAQSTPTRVLIPIGAGYEQDTLGLFTKKAIAHNTNNVVLLRVVLATYGTDALTISPTDRADNLTLAGTRAAEINTICQSQVASGVTCTTTVPDIQIRSDALDPAKAALFSTDVDGVYILGGDQTIAMQVLANTPTETAIKALYMAGAPIAGNSAGSAVQSRYMIGGYASYAYAWDALQSDALDLWFGATDTVTRGLDLGMERAVIEQHVFERGRLARLLHATQRLPGGSHIGIGTDTMTGAVISNESMLSEVTGKYAAVVVDEDSYHAAATAVYTGSNLSLAIHDVAVHILAPGTMSYDLMTRQPISGTAQTAPNISGRSFNMLRGPAMTPLFLAGDLTEVPTGTVMMRFSAFAHQQTKPTLVLTAAYDDDSEAALAANTWRGHLLSLGLSTVVTKTITAATTPADLTMALSDAGAVLFSARDQDRLAPHLADWKAAGLTTVLTKRLQAGVPILLDAAAAAAAGDWISAAPSDLDSSDAFLKNSVPISPGLGLIPNALFEPRALYDYKYGHMLSHIVAHPNLVVFGIERETAIEISQAAAIVRGPRVVLALDGRYAKTLTTGSNNALAASWLLLDTWTTNQRMTEYIVNCPIIRR